MIERAIENWLTSTNERNYQVPFCQVLSQKGQKVIYVSSHRPLEQGKDIITVDSNGDCYAYQLKTGHIDLNAWRRMKGEVQELIELPIVHPSVHKARGHKSFLVTNRDVTDEVRVQIDQMNEDNQRKGRKYSYLDITNGKALLKDFVDAQGDFLPKDLKDLQLFLELFLADGTSLLSRDKYFNFLDNTLFGTSPPQKSNAINAISGSIIITAYLTAPHQVKANHYALFEAWTSLAGSIVRYATGSGLHPKDWLDSLNLAMCEVQRNLRSLREDTLGRKDFLEGDWLGDGAVVYRARATIVLGALASLETHLEATEEKYPRNEAVLQLVKDNIPILWFWGESAFPYFFSVMKYLERAGEKEMASSLLHSLFLALVSENEPTKPIGLPGPYHSICDLLEAMLGVGTQKLDLAEFSGVSFILKPVIHMIARRNGRDVLTKSWPQVSRIRLKEFRPHRVEDVFAWRACQGSNYSEFPNTPQSWEELVKDASGTQDVPEFYVQHGDLLRFFLFVCPHRVSVPLVKLLDSIL